MSLNPNLIYWPQSGYKREGRRWGMPAACVRVRACARVHEAQQWNFRWRQSARKEAEIRLVEVLVVVGETQLMG